MKADHVNAFLVPAVQVLQKMARLEVRVGRVERLTGDSEVGDHLSIIIGLHGQLSGSVVLTAERRTAWTLASRVAREELSSEGEADVRAILAELANTIVGNATGHLFAVGVREGITPPTVVVGPRVGFGFGAGLESVLVPLETEVGRVEVIVSLSKDAP